MGSQSGHLINEAVRRCRAAFCQGKSSARRVVSVSASRHADTGQQRSSVQSFHRLNSEKCSKLGSFLGDILHKAVPDRGKASTDCKLDQVFKQNWEIETSKLVKKDVEVRHNSRNRLWKLVTPVSATSVSSAEIMLLFKSTDRCREPRALGEENKWIFVCVAKTSTWHYFSILAFQSMKALESGSKRTTS
ncbi:uncharacterized protein ACIB01_003968 [Guaruba guarouba]